MGKEMGGRFFGFAGLGMESLCLVRVLRDRSGSGEHLFPEFSAFHDDFGPRGEIAEAGIGDDLFEERGFGRGLLDSGQVAAGNLKAVEEQAGALGVDTACGNALQDFGDGGLDGVTVLGQRDDEGGHAEVTLNALFNGAAGGVVVIAELFATQAGAAAAAAVGKDVAALITFVCRFGRVDDLAWHGVSPSVLKVLKSSKEKVCLWTSGQTLVDSVKCESPARGRAGFDLIYKRSRLGLTLLQMYVVQSKGLVKFRA
jgi:hypothetical protein